MPCAARRRSRRTSLIIVAVATTGAGFALVPAPPQAAAARSKPAVSVVSSWENKIVKTVNAKRRARGLRPVRKHTRLRRAARGHAKYLARTGTASHIGARGTQFWQRIAAAGYPRNRRASETIGLAFGCNGSLAKAIVRDWMNSPQHRKALMRRSYRRIGVGVARRSSCSHTSFVINVAA